MSEDMIDRVIYDETVDALRISILQARELADRIAALEAEASEGERRGLELRRLAVVGKAFEDALRELPIGRRVGLSWLAIWMKARSDQTATTVAEKLSSEALLSRAALVPEATAEGWQTIATAPRDGTEIILHDRGTVGTGFYSEAPEARRGEAGWFWEDDRGNLVIAKNADPTHWMPLPPPPPQEREG